MEKLNEDCLDFVRLLDAHEVTYLIVGGYAVAIYGFPRYTGDIDFFIAIAPENAKRLIRVFEEFWFGDLGLRMEDFSIICLVVGYLRWRRERSAPIADRSANFIQ